MSTKLALMTVLAIVCAEAVMATHARQPRCRTLRPDVSALVARRDARLQGGQADGVKLHASVRQETQLDVIDVLIAYDLSARNWLSANRLETPGEYARIKVAEMNQCLTNSQITAFTFRLVGTVFIDVDATQYRDFWGAVDFDAILSEHIVDGTGNICATGEWRKIVDRREELGADVVSVLVSSGQEGTVGLGYSLENGLGLDYAADPALIPTFGDWAYSVCSIDVADEDWSILHEIGHNMGCGHPDATCASWWVMELGPQLYPYSAGFYLWIGGEGYYTIMSYNFGGLRPDGSLHLQDVFTPLPYFSSPLLTYHGVALGSEYNDNRRTLLNTYAYVAQYRVSRLPPNVEPEDEQPSPRVFQTEFRPTKLVNGVAPYIGAVYDGDTPVAILSLKCGKAGTKGKTAGKSKVSASVVGLDGKNKTAKAVNVTCGYDASAVLAVKDWGTLSLTLGGEGFIGTLGQRYTVKTASVGGDWTRAHARVDVDFGANPGALPQGTLQALLPTGDNAEPVLQDAGKWKFAGATAVKWAKPKGGTEKELIVDTGTRGEKSNSSSMKLVYTPKKGTFKGSFRIYALQTRGNRTSLATYIVNVTGIVVNGIGQGVAKLKKTGATWNVTVGGED